ncbi:MAG: AAA family ATPase [Acidobacteriota bacterium]|nr:AAA family ATPase [Acidobacteriota bacterium]MDH3525110.1 AAA family ATPase [Acidobacteriota bacterium]
MPEPVRPKEIAAALGRRVIGQMEAVKELSIALAKKLRGLSTGNVLMVGSSGTGKTTLMRAVEAWLAERADPAQSWPLIRVHANVLAEEASRDRPGEAILVRLLNRARERFGDEPVEKLLAKAGAGLVFVDEVDKIRSHVGGAPNTTGIRAQEALLTLIENEAVPMRLPDWAGGRLVTVDASRLLFVAAGAFEGLYDAVYDRVTIGADRGSLQAMSVFGDGGEVHQELQFSLRDWLRYEDLFAYGLTPQFLARFDSLVLLDALDEDTLVEIFLNDPESGLAQAREYFSSLGVELAISPAAVRRVAREAARQPRLGARALKEVFRRVMRDVEFDPRATAGGALMLDLPEIEKALGG